MHPQLFQWDNPTRGKPGNLSGKLIELAVEQKTIPPKNPNLSVIDWQI
jgi:hypothetical protein